MTPAPSLWGMTRGYAIPYPYSSRRFFTSPGLTPEAATRMRTSPGPGSGFGISPTIRTSRAAPCDSYHAALIGRLHFEGDSGARLPGRDLTRLWFEPPRLE